MTAAADPSSHPLNGKPVLRNPSRPATTATAAHGHKNTWCWRNKPARAAQTRTILFRRDNENRKRLIYKILQYYISRAQKTTTGAMVFERLGS